MASLDRRISAALSQVEDLLGSEVSARDSVKTEQFERYAKAKDKSDTRSGSRMKKAAERGSAKGADLKKGLKQRQKQKMARDKKNSYARVQRAEKKARTPAPVKLAKPKKVKLAKPKSVKLGGADKRSANQIKKDTGRCPRGYRADKANPAKCEVAGKSKGPKVKRKQPLSGATKVLATRAEWAEAHAILAMYAPNIRILQRKIDSGVLDAEVVIGGVAEALRKRRISPRLIAALTDVLRESLEKDNALEMTEEGPGLYGDPAGAEDPWEQYA